MIEQLHLNMQLKVLVVLINTLKSTWNCSQQYGRRDYRVNNEWYINKNPGESGSPGLLNFSKKIF